MPLRSIPWLNRRHQRAARSGAGARGEIGTYGDELNHAFKQPDRNRNAFVWIDAVLTEAQRPSIRAGLTLP